MLSVFSYFNSDVSLQPPSKPRALHHTPTKVTLNWDKPVNSEKSTIKGYTVTAHKFVTAKFVDAPTTDDGDITFDFDDLEPDSEYQFLVKAVYEEHEEAPESKMSEVVLTDRPSNQPGRPNVSQFSSKSIMVKWTPPNEMGAGIRVKGYKIKCLDANSRKVVNDTHYTALQEQLQHEIVGLDPGRRYMFTVTAKCTKGWSLESEPSVIIELFEKEKDRLNESSKLVKKGTPSVYQLQLDQKPCEINGKIRKCELGRPRNGTTEKVIMIVGATGAGKTTLINGMINYVVGVDWKDKYRFKLIVDQEEAKNENQAKSQTQWITSYTIHAHEDYKVPYSLTIIDTPGFGDTSGIKRDQEITKQIHVFFSTAGKNGIDHLDAIGFVAQSALPRLTPTQSFIFDSILSLFGKDISENIFLMITFADGQKPPVLSAVRDAKLPYQKYFKFNNSALFAGNVFNDDDATNWEDSNDSKFAAKFWNMGTQSFCKFFEELNVTPSKSLLLTQDVLNERQSIEARIIGIQQEIKSGVNKLEQLKTEVDVLKHHEADIDKNKDFTYTVEEESVTKEDIPMGRYITNCLQCNFTCHYPCSIPDDEQKAGCAAMTGPNHHCGVCPKRCYWNIHKNMRFRYVTKRVKTEKSAADLKKRYEEAEGKKLNAEELVKKVVEDVYAVRMKVLALTDDVRKSLDRLKDIALKPNPLTHLEFIDILIESEKSEHRQGWKDRVAQLQDVREQAETLNRISQDGYDPFAEYKKKAEEVQKEKGGERAWDIAFKYIRNKMPDIFNRF